MKLATLNDGTRDGQLIVVARDLKTAQVADIIAPTLQRALDDWNFIAPQLDALYADLNQGRAKRPFDFDPAHCMAPLPRAYQWLDASAYNGHLQRMKQATGVDWPAVSNREPLIYQGGSDDFLGAREDAPFPEESHGIDFEAELAVVIGATARDVPPQRALEHVLGYTCLNDVSARDLQFGDGQWIRGKSLDTFCPMGPWLVTADEIPDPQTLRIRCLVNGEVVQDASTSQMLHGVAALIAFCSRFFTLDPGDVIATGTPAGVGVFRKPPRFLGDGDEVVIDIEAVGSLTNRCRIVPG